MPAPKKRTAARPVVLGQWASNVADPPRPAPRPIVSTAGWDAGAA